MSTMTESLAKPTTVPETISPSRSESACATDASNSAAKLSPPPPDVGWVSTAMERKCLSATPLSASIAGVEETSVAASAAWVGVLVEG
jgi:hypothetical protein